MNNNLKILLIISGGIAAYKSLELIRIFKKNNIKVQVVLTKGGAQFVTPLSIAALSEEKVYQDLFSLKDETEMGHIQLSRKNDLILVAPASANIIAHVAAGIANDLATTIILAANKPVLFAPSMNVEMWNNSITKNNVQFLKNNNYKFVGPEPGDLACGEEGNGRMSEPENIKKYISSMFKKKKLNIDVLVTAGPTFEAIDPVRFIGNRSSGKQGIAIAKAFSELGANVTLVLGPSSQTVPEYIRVINIETANDMLEAVKTIKNIDVAICAAAVSDWAIKNPSKNKIKKNNEKIPRINFALNPDILAYISNKKKDRPKLVIGFAAETNNLINNAKDKLKSKKCDWIIANNVLEEPGVFGGDNNNITLITKDNIESWDKCSKTKVAKKLASKVIKEILDY
ncbi:bifunctional phosphopantothenoylcysteine decarboxylase/phosphopantothenate--cysteine ligase CoaBC [Alphaproteobacteria bacterium]|nr:bifunctional phosphopantothenoylcysteine decarboxylase/phosphopantothenate--cysteine ligase CoaBC [Alphaproteobacteria bacterium]